MLQLQEFQELFWSTRDISCNFSKNEALFLSILNIHFFAHVQLHFFFSPIVCELWDIFSYFPPFPPNILYKYCAPL